MRSSVRKQRNEMVDALVLNYVHEQWNEHKLDCVRLSLKPRKPKLHLNWISEVVTNRLNSQNWASSRRAAIPLTPDEHWFVCLYLNNRRRVVKAALDRLVRDGALMFFKGRVREWTSKGRRGEKASWRDHSQVFWERCYMPANLLEALAHAAR